MMLQRQSARDASPSDDEKAFFNFTYRPLSNLPTPPPSSRDSESAAHSPVLSLFDDSGAPLDPELRGPAIHLVNLIPTSASLATASVSSVQSMLARAGLPLETVALAVCILDSLGVRFARAWRLNCPLGAVPSPQPEEGLHRSRSKRHTLPPNLLHETHRQLHIDAVLPEVIILAALVIAAKFAHDPHDCSSAWYCKTWGRDSWSAAQLSATEKCIFESLGWRIMPLCEEDCIQGALADMRIAGQMSFALTPPGSTGEFGHARSKTEVVGLGVTFGDESTATTPRGVEMDGYFG